MPERDIVIALVLGVLLPALISRPAMLLAHPMADHIRRRWDIGYTMFAFAGASFVYTTVVTLLRPDGGFSARAEHAAFGAGLIIFALLCINHLPPLLADRRGRLVAAVQLGGAIICGVFAGGFFAIDQLYRTPVSHTPAASYASWCALLLIMFALGIWYGPSPGDRLLAFRVKRRIKRKRRKRPRKKVSVS